MSARLCLGSHYAHNAFLMRVHNLIPAGGMPTSLTEACWIIMIRRSGYLWSLLVCPSVPFCAGLKDYKVLKTTQSGYVGYLRDKYTLLPETEDRIAATSITATWRCPIFSIPDFLTPASQSAHRQCPSVSSCTSALRILSLRRPVSLRDGFPRDYCLTELAYRMQ